MKYLSVCDGIGAAHIWHDVLGWECVGTAEIEPFPAAVVEQRYGFKNFGDFTRINRDGGPQCGPVDLLVGGTPCQSFSIAGLRKGLDDPRGNLALEYLALAERLRCPWVVWENVPGVLSSVSHVAPDHPYPTNDVAREGSEVDLEDVYSAEELHAFNSFLAALSELGYGYAWRTLDAQFAGVPQRRRRVFVVGYFGDWRCAAAVLFERHSLQGHTPPSRRARERVAAPLTSGAGTGRGNPAGRRQEDDEIVANPLPGHHARNDNDNDTYVVAPLVFDTTQVTSKANYSNPQPGDPCHPIAAEGHAPCVAFDSRWRGPEAKAKREARAPQCSEDQTGALDTVKPWNVAGPKTGVRRLTPRECERLQGFPDDYTLIKFRGKPAGDALDRSTNSAGERTRVNALFWNEENPMDRTDDPRAAMRQARMQTTSRVQVAAPERNDRRTILDCFVPGEPKPQQRPRLGKNGVFSPKSGWYDLLVMAFNACGVPNRPLSDNLRVDADFFLPRPKKLMGKEHDDGPLWAPVRPDRDNLDKALLDAMTAAKLLADDNCVVAGEPRKLYHAKNGRPGVRILISLAGKPQPLVPKEIPA